MPECVYCGGPNTGAREEIGYRHCTKTDCVAAWRRSRIEDSGLKLVLMHKQGLAWVTDDEVKGNDMKRQGG